ncbi:MAG: enoyl-CoA hydratase/isomerase family protein [Gammaproteobacteria bacterium]|nr:enoyl-CoA hydratase/isomerase family protein [Gammaproteobacteria bacterium]
MAAIQFQQLGQGSRFIGHAELCNERKLNALDHDMAKAFLDQLSAWEQDPNFAGLLITGTGDRAFCAGGDVKELAVRKPEEDARAQAKRGAAYFGCEYELDEKIWRCAQPTMVIAHGITMGGGMGLMQGCDFRLITETTRIAMPETAIGFFPDVGSSWFLNRVNYHMGEILGISGMHINGADAIALNLADYSIQNETRGNIVEALSQMTLDDTDTQTIFMRLIGQNINNNLPASNVIENLGLFEHIRRLPTLEQRYEALSQLNGSDWLESVAKTTVKGSPLSIAITSQMLFAARFHSLKECFELEARLGEHVVEYGDFVEGVRAVLVDKDHSPDWSFKDLASTPTDRIHQVLEG